ncbi:hypothetical protein ABTW95_20155 [Spirillospora sp. NPDC127506]
MGVALVVACCVLGRVVDPLVTGGLGGRGGIQLIVWPMGASELGRLAVVMLWNAAAWAILT